jgi:preprotein translocase subunit SecG
VFYKSIFKGIFSVQILFTVLHIAVSIILILVVLLQAGKGASMGAAFGGSSQTVFGSSGPGTFLGKMTTIVATVFMLTSLFLSYSAYHKGSSLMEKAASQTQQQTVPAPAEKAPGTAEQQAPPAQQK